MFKWAYNNYHYKLSKNPKNDHDDEDIIFMSLCAILIDTPSTRQNGEANTKSKSHFFFGESVKERAILNQYSWGVCEQKKIICLTLNIKNIIIFG